MNFIGALVVITAVAMEVGRAQAPRPDVPAIAGRFEAELATLEKAEAAAIEKILQRYLDDLRAAETVASGNGKVAETAAILKELELVAPGLQHTDAAPGLPSVLFKRRTDALSAVAAAEREATPKFQQAAGAYLQMLTQMEATVPASSPVRQQMTELKARIAAAGASGAKRHLDDSTFDHTEWLWQGRADKVWLFLPNGKITVDPGTNGSYAWKITGPDKFVIGKPEGKAIWEFQYTPFATELKGASIEKPANKERLVFKRAVPK